MNTQQDYQVLVVQILSKCESIVSSYPYNLKEAGYKYLKKLKLLKDCENRAGGFCYLMPLWMKEEFGLSKDFCCQLALGNVFGLLYFMSQDELMDGGVNVDKSLLLPLSSLFYNDFTGCYRELFPHPSPFWSCFTKYLQEWAQSVSWEHQEHIGKVKPYTEGDFLLLSRKAAGMKIPFAALCLASGKPELIEQFEDFVDYDQICYQMIDDWRDWKTDLLDQHYTHFLIKVMEYCKIEDPSHITESSIKRAVFNGNVLEEVMNTALAYNQKSLECLRGRSTIKLYEYLEMIRAEVHRIIVKVQAQKEAALHGGLSFYLTTIKAVEEKQP